MELHSLDDLLVHQLNDLYSAEQQLMKALPDMAEAATSPDLRMAFQEHLVQTQTQAERIESIFESFGTKPEKMKCKGMEGLIEEGREILKGKGEPAVKDAALIAAAQRVEHYEIAGYGCARTYAEELGYQDAAELLQETLDEESQTNERLTMLAESHINIEAEEAEEE